MNSLPILGTTFILRDAFPRRAAPPGDSGHVPKSDAAPGIDSVSTCYNGAMKFQVTLLALALLAGCRASGDYADEIRDWQASREESLRSESGYLALAGLQWLEPGATSFGSGPLNDWPWSFGPTRAGVLHLRGGEVTVVAEPGVDLIVDEAVVRSAALVDDTPGPPTRVTVGDGAFWVIERAGRLGVRLRHPGSEVLENYSGTERYAVRKRWRCEARFVRFEHPKPIAIPNVMGSTFEGESPGILIFDHAGETRKLTVTSESETRLFVVFGDESNGDGTYGGGRFLSVDLPEGDGRTVVDFNKAYNPPCAYSPYTTCPLPLPENRLPFRVEAGERTYLGRGPGGR